MRRRLRRERAVESPNALRHGASERGGQLVAEAARALGAILGRNESARRIKRSADAARSGRNRDGGIEGPAACCCSIRITLSAVNGLRPVTNS